MARSSSESAGARSGFSRTGILDAGLLAERLNHLVGDVDTGVNSDSILNDDIIVILLCNTLDRNVCFFNN